MATRVAVFGPEEDIKQEEVKEKLVASIDQLTDIKDNDVLFIRGVSEYREMKSLAETLRANLPDGVTLIFGSDLNMTLEHITEENMARQGWVRATDDD